MGTPRRAWLNVVCASPVWSGRVRRRLLRWGGVRIGNAETRHGVTIVGEGEVVIDSKAFLNVGVLLEAATSIRIEAGVRIGPRVQLLTSSHEIGLAGQRGGALTESPLTIGRGAWLGAGVIVCPGADVAPGCVIAAGSVIVEATQANGLYAGVPARRIRELPVVSLGGDL